MFLADIGEETCGSLCRHVEADATLALKLGIAALKSVVVVEAWLAHECLTRGRNLYTLCV